MAHTVWRPESPLTCYMQGGEPGEPLVLVLECEGPRTRSWNAQGQKMDIPLKKRELSHASFFFLPFRSIWALDGLNGCPARLVRVVFFILSTDSNANLFQKHPKRYPEIKFSRLPDHSFAQSSRHIKLTITICNLLNYLKLSKQ